MIMISRYPDALSRLPLPGGDFDTSSNLVKWTQEATTFNIVQVKSLPINAKFIARESMCNIVLAQFYIIHGMVGLNGRTLHKN